MSSSPVTDFLRNNISYTQIADADGTQKQKLITAALDVILTGAQIYTGREDQKALNNERVKVITTCIPFGLENRFANCWLNATIQLIRCSKLIKTHPEFLSDQLNIQKILFQVAQEYSDFSRDPNIQQDPFYAIISLFNPKIKWTQTRTDLVSSETTESTIELPMMQLFPSSNDFNELVQGFKEVQPIDSFLKFTYSLKEPPETLFVQIQRFREDQTKNCQDIENIPMQFEQYELLGSIIHLGNSIHAGHYIALVRRDQSWYYIDDSHVFCYKNNKWTLEAGVEQNRMPKKIPEDLLKQSYILLYQTDVRDWEWILPTGGVNLANDQWTYFGYLMSLFSSKKP